MRILETPANFRSPTHNYPRHMTGLGLEEYVDRYLRQHAEEIQTEWVYLPIFWQNNLFAQKRGHKSPYRASSEVQRFLNTRLQPNVRYFTVTVADEGMYERVPDNVTIFGAGGHGSIPVPLLSTPHPVQRCVRDVVAFFVGNIDTGGPVVWPGRPPESSWDPNGAGSRIRQKMRDALRGAPGVVVQSGNGNRSQDRQAFLDLAGRSLYGLAPRGYGKTSYRLYEVMQLGCVPVYCYDDPWLPYQDQLEWSEFALLVPESSLEQLPAILKSQTDAEWRARRKKLDELWDDYFTMEGVARQIVRYVLSQRYEPKPPREALIP